ncbi:cupin domain-containing protein [Scopulibacillus cellulosilyticus]|uniref:Cupin domain-containing protein n=1 Tax=Scopulibacillus cellulosilyticus TaxID=2665665 RepID=A0ABW2PSC8_9BACL
MDIQSQTYYFDDDGTIPNNPDLPLLIYENVLGQNQSFNDIFQKNFWINTWVGGVFSYHHFHSTAHEVLGVESGNAILRLGGEKGKDIEVNKGDVLIIPAGVGHKNIKSSADFTVVGGYPKGQDWDLCTGESKDRPKFLQNIKHVPLPETDPVFGSKGPLIDAWKIK